MAPGDLSYTLLGQVGVDSGTLAVVDPCYVAEGADWEAVLHDMKSSFEITLGAGGAVWSRTADGDGYVSVYHVYREQELVGLFVDFAGMLDPEDDGS